MDTRFGSLVMEDSGRNPARCVVMLHGLGGTANTFEPLMPVLDGWRVIRPDLPGAGRTPTRPGLRDIRDLSRAVTDGLAAIGVSRAVIVGHSMGTLIAQHMAVSAPHRVQALVLFGALTEPTEAARLAFSERAATAERDGMTGIADAVSTASLSPRTRERIPAVRAFVRESLMRQCPRGYAAHCRVLARASAYPPSGIRCPVHLVTGEDDTSTPRSMAETLHAALPFSTLTLLPGVGHWSTLEAPEACREVLARALADVKTAYPARPAAHDTTDSDR